MALRIIGGKYKGRVLHTPKTKTTRPTQGMLREALFNICQAEIEGACFLDLYAGSGSVGFEALSRGASHVTFVEKNREALLSIKKNEELLNVSSQITLFPTEAIAALKKMKGPFDLVYIDPPYDLPVAPILELLIRQQLLKAHATVFVEERYTPHKEPVLFISHELSLKRSRRFGLAYLHEYTQQK